MKDIIDILEEVELWEYDHVLEQLSVLGSTARGGAIFYTTMLPGLNCFTTTAGFFDKELNPISSKEYYKSFNQPINVDEIIEIFENFVPDINNSLTIIDGLLKLQSLKKESSNKAIIQAAEHDIVYFCDLEDLRDDVTKKDIEYLISCGFHCEEDEFIAMYV